MQSNLLYPGYADIIELVNERILTGVYPVGERVASVREMAVELEVNPITVTRAYERLQRAGVIYPQRGLGCFVTEGAPEQIRQMRIERFYSHMLPQFEHEMRILGINAEDVCSRLMSWAEQLANQPQ